MNGVFATGTLGLAGGTALALGILLALRQRSYGCHLHYDPRQDCVERFSGPGVETISVRANVNGFVMPEIPPGVSSAFLGLAVRARLSGQLFDPSIEMKTPGFRDVQVLERGVRGLRHFNISRLLTSSAPGARITLRARHLVSKRDSVRLHVSRERVEPSDRVLVVAPHPDDAEIAAFGLYSDTKATVVTVSSGNESDRYTGHGRLNLPRTLVAKMRVWDSITVPQLGGVRPGNAVNLCYPDGKLGRMYADRSRDFQRAGDSALDFLELRRMNQSPLVRSEPAACSWDSLVRDLSEIIRATKPTVVVTPHPWLDPHSDHKYTTIAVGEALRSADLNEGRFFFYTNHNRHSELWPFGPAGSGVAPLPVLPSDVVDCDAFYSHLLSEERQREKYLALEAMHDLRDIGTPQPQSRHARLRRIRSEIGALLNGLGLHPTSYLRRAVRPDELFFVAPFSKGQALCERVLGSPAASGHAA